MKVIKFGGSSLATGAQFQKIIAIIRADPQRRIIVTSAPGKRFSQDTKVTDLLIKYSQLVINRQDFTPIVNEIWQRYVEIAQTFGLSSPQIANLKQQLDILPTTTFANNDYLTAAFKAHGEKLTAQLLALILQHQNLDAQYISPQDLGLLVSDQPNDAEVLPQTYLNLRKIQLQHQYYIVPGFYGLTEKQQIATFSRGGSDITGAILAKGFQADLYENFTDVDAIYAANPQIVAHPQAIKTMTYRELRELSYAGFSVFHDEALIPAIQAQIPINVKNTNHPDLPGTLIVPEKDFHPQQLMTGVATSNHFVALYLHRYLLNKEVGFTLKLLQIFYKYHISYEHMPSGIDDVTIIFDQRQFTPQIAKQMCQEIQDTLHPDQLEWIDDYAITMIVGEGFRQKIGVLKKIIDPLAHAHIGLHMINQGASRISIMIGTKQSDADKAVRAIYHSFFE